MTTPGSSTDVEDELRDWLAENWDPDLTVGDWWERLGLAGWAAPGLPTTAYGRGLSRNDSVAAQQQIADFGALGAPAGLGLLLAAPTIATHGTQEQIDHYVRDIVTGKTAWCQLFSEPGAGSDLAGLGTRAVQDGDEWTINGQKVWTSLGHVADLGMLLARTNPDVPKHRGITWFVLDMHQPGVEVRPLKEMTGHAMFNEVFMSDAHVSSAAIIGEAGAGWVVANTTLAYERSGLGAGGGAAGRGGAMPGTVARHLELRAGDLAPNTPDGGGRRVSRAAPRASDASTYINLAKANGSNENPGIRQDLVRLYTLGELARFNNLRLKAAKAKGDDIPGMANLSKLAMSETVRLNRDLGLRIMGPAGMLHAYRDEDRAVLDEVTRKPFLAMVTTTALYAQAPPIYGGTDQIQKNIVAERVLGLPKDPTSDHDIPFSQLKQNG